MAKLPGAAWGRASRKFDAAEDSGFGTPWNGSQSSPERFHTNAREPPMRPVQFDSRQTWVGQGKLFMFIQLVPTTRGTDPQAQRVPSRRSASVEFHGQHTATQSSLVPTCTGLVWRGPGPLPNWPIALSPQAQRVPSRLSATEWTTAAATLTQTWFESTSLGSAPRPAGAPRPPAPGPTLP